MIGFVAFPVVPLAIGFLLLRAATGGRRYCRHDLFRVALGLGLGTGLTSCAYFVALMSGIPCAAWDAVLLASAAALWFRFGRQLRCIFCAAAVPSVNGGKSVIRTLLPWVLAVLAAGALLLFATLISQAPHGQWDAWSIYNLRARFLFRLGPAWRQTFPAETPWSHPDYPLLLPASIARVWTYLSHESTLAQAGVALGFSAATVTIIVTTIAILRDRTQALAAGILLLCTPFFVVLAAWQYADVPVAFFLLAATSMMFLADRFRDQALWFGGFSGLAAGFAAWTKNEGIMLFIVFAFAGTLPLFLGSQKRVAAARYAAMVAGALIPLACLVYFKAALAPANDLVAGQSASSALSQAGNAGRYVDVALAFANHAFTFAGVFASPVLALILYAFCVGLRKPLGITLRAGWFFLFAAVAGYFFTYILSPGDLNFRLASLDRVFIQLWPAVLLVSILSTRELS